MVVFFLIILTVWRLCCLEQVKGATSNEIDQLYEDIFYTYQKMSRPNKNATDKIVVHLSSFLIRIIDVDERNQVITVNLWLEMQWYDWRFEWSSHSYGGIKKLNVPADQIWTPDIVLYNNADGLPHIPLVTDVLVYNDGRVLWSTPTIYKAFCQINIAHFPFDEQRCKLKFGGWTHDGYVLDLRQVAGDQILRNISDPDELDLPGLYLGMGMDLSYYHSSAEWDLMNLTSVRHEKLYPGCCGQQFYIDITFWITIRRKALFFTINLVIPCMLIAFLTTFVFYLTDHKVTFAISILVALSVFFLVLIDLIPPTSMVVPLFAQYLLFTMFLVTISILSTVVILNIHHRDSSTHDMPKWVRIIFLNYLPRALRMKVPEWHQVDPKLESIKKLIRKNLSYNERFRGSFNRRPSPYFMSVTELDREKSLTALALSRGMHPAIIREFITNVNSIADHFATLEDNSKDSDDWSYVAFVIDRVFLILFTLINLIGTVVFVMKTPMLQDDRHPLVVPPYPVKPLGGDILNIR